MISMIKTKSFPSKIWLWKESKFLIGQNISDTYSSINSFKLLTKKKTNEIHCKKKKLNLKNIKLS